MTEAKKRGRWVPGQSGNPLGKARDSGKLQKLRADLAAHLPEILNKLVEQAKAGDIQACRLVLERCLPACKPIEMSPPLALPDGSLAMQGRAVLAAVAAGEIGPTQGAQLLSALGSLARVVEIDELTARLSALEAKHEKP